MYLFVTRFNNAYEKGQTVLNTNSKHHQDHNQDNYFSVSSSLTFSFSSIFFYFPCVHQENLNKLNLNSSWTSSELVQILFANLVLQFEHVHEQFMSPHSWSHEHVHEKKKLRETLFMNRSWTREQGISSNLFMNKNSDWKHSRKQPMMHPTVTVLGTPVISPPPF